MEPFVIYSDVVGLLRKKPEMYLGHDKATAPQLATMLASDALILGEHEVRVRQLENGWTVVTARGNWTARGPGSDLPRSQLFRQLTNLPEAGLNEARHEIYVLAYARDVFVATAQGIEVIQGTVPEQDLRQFLETDHFHIGFRLQLQTTVSIGTISTNGGVGQLSTNDYVTLLSSGYYERVGVDIGQGMTLMAPARIYASSDPIAAAGLQRAQQALGYVGAGILIIVPGPEDAVIAGAVLAKSAVQGARLVRHLRQLEKYGGGGFKELTGGRIRYYGELEAARNAGPMAGRRLVREWDPVTGATRTWHETLDSAGRVRIVRPETGGLKIHYEFDEAGNYVGSW